jgi:hypothetical protein
VAGHDPVEQVRAATQRTHQLRPGRADGPVLDSPA